MRIVGARVPTVGEDRKIYSTVDSTATAGQTVFSVNYDEGKVAVWLNGIRLVQGQDFSYTVSGVGSQITLSSGIVANDYVEVVGFQGIYSGNALVEDRFVVGTNSTGSGGAYNGSAGNHTTVFPVANNAGDLVCVYRNGIKLVHTTDFVVSASGNTVTLQSASNTADEITVHVIGILQHSNFVQATGGTFTGAVDFEAGPLRVNTATTDIDLTNGALVTSTAQKDAIVDGSTAISRSGNNLTFAGDISIADNNKAQFGAGNDLQIYHDGSNSYVDDAGTGRLYLRGNDRVQIQKYTGEDMVTATVDDGVKLYHDNAKRIETTSTGVAITGGATATGNVIVDTDTLYVDTTNDRVGINRNPVQPLHVGGIVQIEDFHFTGGHTRTGSLVNVNLGNDSTYASTTALVQIKNVGNRGAKGHVSGSDLLRGDFSDANGFIFDKSGNLDITGTYNGLFPAGTVLQVKSHFTTSGRGSSQNNLTNYIQSDGAFASGGTSPWGSLTTKQANSTLVFFVTTTPYFHVNNMSGNFTIVDVQVEYSTNSNLSSSSSTGTVIKCYEDCRSTMNVSGQQQGGAAGNKSISPAYSAGTTVYYTIKVILSYAGIYESTSLQVLEVAT